MADQQSINLNTWITIGVDPDGEYVLMKAITLLLMTDEQLESLFMRLNPYYRGKEDLNWIKEVLK